MGVAPVEEFGVESFFGCNGVLLGDGGLVKVVFCGFVGGRVMEVGGFVTLECGCGGWWTWWSFLIVIVGFIIGGCWWLVSSRGSSSSVAGAERMVEGLEEAAAHGRLVAGPFLSAS